MEQIVQLNDGLYNAGLLGFVRVSERMGISLENERGNSLAIDFSMFEGGAFTEAYFDELCDRYESQTKYAKLMQELSRYTGENPEIPVDLPMAGRGHRQRSPAARRPWPGQ